MAWRAPGGPLTLGQAVTQLRTDAGLSRVALTARTSLKAAALEAGAPPPPTTVWQLVEALLASPRDFRDFACLVLGLALVAAHVTARLERSTDPLH